MTIQLERPRLQKQLEDARKQAQTVRQGWSDAIARQFEEATKVREGLKKPHDRARELILRLSGHGQLQKAQHIFAVRLMHTLRSIHTPFLTMARVSIIGLFSFHSFFFVRELSSLVYLPMLVHRTTIHPAVKAYDAVGPIMKYIDEVKTGPIARPSCPYPLA